jgi:ribosomal protein L11 methylase PrmA
MKQIIVATFIFCYLFSANGFSQVSGNNIQQNEFEKILDKVEYEAKQKDIRAYEKKIQMIECILQDFDSEIEPRSRVALSGIIMKYRTKIQELSLDKKCCIEELYK